MNFMYRIMLVTLVLGIANCSGGAPGSRISKKDKNSDGTANDQSGPAVSGGRDLNDCNLNPCQAKNSDVQTTGANLVDIRCDFVNPSLAVYDTSCRTVVRRSDGVEVVVSQANLPETATVTFAPPTFTAGDLASAPECSINQVTLTQSCSVKTSKIGQKTTLGFNLSFVDTAAPTKNHNSTAEISLGASVGAAWGNVIGFGLATTPGAGLSPIRMEPLGTPEVDASGVKTDSGLAIEPTSVCADGETTYFTSSSTIWEKRKDGGVYIFAGGPGVQENLTNRFKIRFGWRISIACGKNYLVVSDIVKNRIVAIPRTGPVLILAGKVDVAGVPVIGYSGDGGPANLATINLTYRGYSGGTDGGGGVAVLQGATGDTIYFADMGNNRIRKIGPDQKISTIASDASIIRPQNVAVGPNGDVYFASMGHVRDTNGLSVFFAIVQKIDSLGKIATVLGLADALSASVTGPTLKINPYLIGGSAWERVIISVAVANDNTVYVGVSETGNVVKLVNEVGSLVFDAQAEKSYPGILGYVKPVGLSVDPLGNLLVASRGKTNQSIYSVDGLGTVKAIIGNHRSDAPLQGLMSTMLLDNNALALDPVSLDIYAAHAQSFIFKGDSKTGKYHSVAGCVPSAVSNCTAPANSPQAATASQIRPVSLSVRVNPSGYADSGHGDIYYLDDRHTVNKITPAGVLTKIAGISGVPGFSGDGGLAASAKLNNPAGLAVARDGTVYIADFGNNRIRQVDPSTRKISTIAGKTSEYQAPDDGDGGLATNAIFSRPSGIAVDDRDLTKKVVYFSDSDHGSIRKIDASGIITTVLGTHPSVDYNNDLAVLRSTPITMLVSTAATTFTVSGYQPVADTKVTLTTTGTLPTGFFEDKTYYVTSPVTTGTSTTFQLSLTGGGAAIKGTGTQSGIHSLNTNQVKLYNPTEIAIGRNGDLYVIDKPYNSGDRLSLMSMDSSGVMRFKTLFTAGGPPPLPDCSVGKANVSALTAIDLKTKLQTSLSTMCSGGGIKHLAVGNTCNDPVNGKFSLVFSQIFMNRAVGGSFTGEHQIIQMQMPCFN
jgi:sugar lactone lactonase YvrE